MRRDTHSITPIASTQNQAGGGSSGDSRDPTKRNTNLIPSVSDLSTTYLAGTRRSIPMRILQKHLLSGWRLTLDGGSAMRIPPHWPSCYMLIELRANTAGSHPS